MEISNQLRNVGEKRSISRERHGQVVGILLVMRNGFQELITGVPLGLTVAPLGLGWWWWASSRGLRPWLPTVVPLGLRKGRPVGTAQQSIGWKPVLLSFAHHRGEAGFFEGADLVDAADGV
jgi:hypothetical protein